MADPATTKEGRGQCKWERLRSKWESEFTILPGRGSWLDEKKTPWGVGCKVCNAAGLTGSLAQYKCNTTRALQKQNFLKHQKSKSHKAAVQEFVGGAATGPVAAPPVQCFEDLAKDIKSGESARSRKRRQMTYCLAEAIKARDQDFIRLASAVALFRDERKGRVAIRFRAVSQDLEVRCGTMGLEIQPGTGARNLTKATHRIMKRFCSRFANCPPDSRQKSRQGKARLKMPLLRHLRNVVTCVTTDAAADEVLSSELMRASVWTELQEQLTPNLRFVVRDKAHASRRITSRPWSADVRLQEIMSYMCAGKYSIAKQVQFSEEVKRIFVAFASDTDAVLRRAVGNFRAAAHRFESYSKPLGRTCLFIHACVRTALRIMRTRSDASSKKAREWLLWVTEERALLAAMLADAADSSIRLTRLMDSEDVDPAVISCEVGFYLSSIRALFQEGDCLKEFGYTTTMLETLKSPLVFQIGYATKCFGDTAGVSQATQQRCLARMQAWIKLAEAAVACEFPTFEIAQAGSYSPTVT